MATVAHLAVALTARTQPFLRGMSRATSAVAGLSLGIAKLGAGVVGLAGVGGLGALAVATGVTIGRLDRLAKTANKLSLNPQVLLNLRDLAERSGASVEQLDMGLQRFLRRVGEAKFGRGEALPALEELGLAGDRSFLDAQPELQLERVAKALANVTDEQRRLALTFKFFDSEGVVLTQTLSELARSGYDRLERSQRKLGRVFSPRSARVIESITEKWDQLKQAFSGRFIQVVTALAPSINELLKGIVGFVKGANLKDFIDGFREALKDLPAFLKNLKIKETLDGWFESATQKAQQLLGSFGGLRGMIASVRGVMERITIIIDLVVAKVDQLLRRWRKIKQIPKAIGELTDVISDVAKTRGFREAGGLAGLAASNLLGFQRGGMAETVTRALPAAAGVGIDAADDIARGILGTVDRVARGGSLIPGVFEGAGESGDAILKVLEEIRDQSAQGAPAVAN